MKNSKSKIQAIKNKNILERTIEEEYQLAKYEKRQPFCVYCGESLEVTQTHYVPIYWNWDKKEKKFIKDDRGGDAEKPYCLNCETKDWDFIDFKMIDF